jgi:pantoate--beta-alanine ligase
MVGAWRRAGDKIALVPTMGALHAGHLELVRLAHRHAGKVVVSIFVNPAQFAPHEDLDRYPRTFDADLAQLATVGCDLVWAPSVAEMYPPGHATRVVPAGAAQGLESDFRPHFFAGVATVCTKLFTQVAPDYAIYGEKDFQQLAVMRQLVRDLDLPLKIVGAPTVREADGLAMSSRNRYLSVAERGIAPALYRTLRSLAQALAAEGASLSREKVEQLTNEAVRMLVAAGFAKIDYVAVRDAVTLAPVEGHTGRPMRILAAAWLGQTRLIDNIPA